MLMGGGKVGISYIVRIVYVNDAAHQVWTRAERRASSRATMYVGATLITSAILSDIYLIPGRACAVTNEAERR